MNELDYLILLWRCKLKVKALFVLIRKQRRQRNASRDAAPPWSDNPAKIGTTQEVVFLMHLPD